MKLDFERHNISFVREKLDINEDDKSLLKNILSRDPLAEISEQVSNSTIYDVQINEKKIDHQVVLPCSTK